MINRRRILFRTRLVALALIALPTLSIFASAANAEPAQLVIHRAANFGTAMALRVWIDGTVVAAVGIGRDFTATLSPGRHVISVVAVPNRWFEKPWDMELRARSGQRYEFTAMWHTTHVELQ